MKGFFSRPHEFSFKDALAILIILPFIYYCYCALKSNQALELVKALIAPIGIILGGYFVQESAQVYFDRTQKPQQQSLANFTYEQSNYDQRYDEDWGQHV